jgi:TolB-like protein/AraC-like DNA-binding protein
MSVRPSRSVAMAPTSSAGPAKCTAPASGPIVLPYDIKKTIAYMRDHMGQPVTMADLTRVSGVAARTLRKHFRSFLEVSPLGYLRAMRLAALRDELLHTARPSSITEIAARYGFHRLGRFSAEYHRRFGEHPSRTLRRAHEDLAQEQGGCSGNDASACPERGHDVSRLLRVSRERPSVVVLPFWTAIADQRFFADTLAEGIACSLCQMRSIGVSVAKSSSSAAWRDLQRLARDRSARYRLTGRLSRAGDRLRVIVGLFDAASERQIWGDSFDGESADLFRLQDHVTQGVTRAILPNIRDAEIERARRKRPEDLDAYDLTMRALPLAFAANPDAARQALDLLARAMMIDPDYALPVAMAAWCHAQLITYNGTRALADERACALRLAGRAHALDSDDDPLIITARCAVHTMLNDLETGAALLERALALDPTSPWAWERSGWLKTYLGQPAVAIRHFRRAIGLAPAGARNAHRYIGIGSACFDAGRYLEAARWKRKAILEDPGTAWVNRTLAVSYARLGGRRAALDSLDALRRCCPDVTIHQVVNAVPFRQDFLDRIAEGLDDLGLPL